MNGSGKKLHSGIGVAVAAALWASTPAIAQNGRGDNGRPPGGGEYDGKVTLIQTGDIHGHLVPRPNLRSDSTGRLEGGVARMYTVIEDIRKDAAHCEGNKGNSGVHADANRDASQGKDGGACRDSNGQKYNSALLINTGDTVQGSGEALFSRGQVMIDVLNLFGYEAHAPGNWDFLYGTTRFEETFKGTNGNAPLANWNALAGNLYYTNQFDPTAVCGRADASGNKYKRVLPPYSIKQVGDVKVGILGMTTARAIAAVGTSVTQNYQFTDAKTEVPCFVSWLRNQEKVDLVVMISELEMARDIQIAETLTPAPDVILNSDMHERTTRPIVAANRDGRQTIIVEQGQDGTVVGELELKVKDGKVNKWKFKQHVVTEDIRENRAIAKKVAEVRRPYVTGTFVPGQRVTVGGNTTELLRPVDEVIASTDVGLHRSNFVDEDMPGVVEGTSHNLIADAMAVIAKVPSSSIRGFRYGTHVSVGGAITMEDIYHYVPIAAKLGRTNKACGADLKFAIEQSTSGTFHPDPTQWTGGWMFGYSGLTMDVDACDGFMGATPTPIGGPSITNRTNPWGTNRGSNVKVNDVPINDMDVYDSRATVNGAPNPTFQKCLRTDNTAYDGYEVAGYWYADDKATINNCNPCRGRLVQVVKTDGTIYDVAGPGVTNPLPNSLEVMDITEAVVKYLREDLGGMVTDANLPSHRLTVKRLPTINPPGYDFDMVQPLKGASAATCPPL